MWVLEALVFLTAIAAAYAAILSIRANIGESPFLFLRLLTMAQDPLPSFIALLGFLIPLVAIAIGFDAINGEFSRRTLSRILAQPIYRDALLLGKFLAGLVALAIGLFSLWLLTIGLGLLLLGLPPNTEEMTRMLGFLVATIAYGGVWLAVALLFSVVFRAPATAALVALGVWLLFALFWSVVTPLVATLIAGPPEGIFGPNLAYLQTAQTLDRISPNTLYAEIALALLQPATRALGPGALQPGAGRIARRAVAGGAELHLDLAAADRACRRDDRDLRDRLCGLSAPGDPRLAERRGGPDGPPLAWSEGSIFPRNVPPTNRPRPPGQRVDHTRQIIAAGRRRKRANRCPQAYPPNSDSIPAIPRTVHRPTAGERLGHSLRQGAERGTLRLTGNCGPASREEEWM